MANLDTRSKRASSVGLLKPYVMALPLPDGTISQGDRQHSAWDYSGILAGAVAVAAGRVTVTFTAKQPGVAFTAKKPTVTFEGQ